MTLTSSNHSTEEASAGEGEQVRAGAAAGQGHTGTHQPEPGCQRQANPNPGPSSTHRTALPRSQEPYFHRTNSRFVRAPPIPLPYHSDGNCHHGDYSAGGQSAGPPYRRQPVWKGSRTTNAWKERACATPPERECL